MPSEAWTNEMTRVLEGVSVDVALRALQNHDEELRAEIARLTAALSKTKEGAVEAAMAAAQAEVARQVEQATAGIRAELAALREQTRVRDARTESPDPNGWVLVFDQQSLGWVAMFESEQQQTWTDWWGLEHAMEDHPFWRPMPPAPEKDVSDGA